MLKLLASQAAIALENARLYADLRLSEERWRNLFESVPVGVTLTGLATGATSQPTRPFRK